MCLYSTARTSNQITQHVQIMYGDSKFVSIFPSLWQDNKFIK